MTIDYALLGMLSWKPLSGYDMKKMVQDSPVMYWSGNNNQIYRSLDKLLKQGYVTNEIQYQNSAPDKKIYHLTDRGQAALMAWVTESEPELPEFKKAFLIRLSWASGLPENQLLELLKQYEALILQQIAEHQEKTSDQKYFPNRTPVEKYLWECVHANILMNLETELSWVRSLEDRLPEFYVQDHEDPGQIS